MTYAFPSMSTQTASRINSSQLFGGSTDAFAAADAGRETLEFSQQLTMRSVAPKGLSEQLRDATASAKRWASQVAMRLPYEARDRFFRQLDRLHDLDEWHESDRPLELDSFKSFVRAYVSGQIGGSPALALTAAGHVTAIWQHAGCKLMIEFVPADRLRYLLSQSIDGQLERVAGETSIHRIRQVLAPFVDAQWFRAS